MDNRLIREALDFDMNESKIEHQQLHPLLNPEQRLIYEQVIDSVHNQRGAFYFVYGPGGMGKTFLYRTIILRLRSERKIVLAVASSAPMTQKYAFEALDKTLRDILGFHKEEKRDKIFGGMTVLIGGDFRQILPVIPKGKRSDVIQACINSADEVCKASTENLEQQHMFPTEFLNTLNFPGMPPHALCLKKELPIMLLRNVNPARGLCNGTRLIITDLGNIQ
ncbi:ATP-dependent DNA helicase PIF1-like protein [Tanacetum coccineum]